MSDAFISYSRRDLEFVRRLVEALESRGKDVWVDVDDIGPAAPWARNLLSAIAEADSFIFVMSPDSLASTECAAELAAAVSGGKRIIPVHLEPASTVPEALSKPNWVPQLGKVADSFDQHVDDLVQAIDTDYEWSHQHTQLGVRALNWAESGKPRHLLLPSEEIAEREAWLDSGRDHSPAPTPLQADYVRASRQAQVSRLRRTRSVVSVALVIAVALAAFALVQRSEAVSKTRTAQSQTLASDATANLTPNPELSVMLALEALQIDHTPQAEAALRRALPLVRTTRTFTLGAPAFTAAWSPDGRTLLTGSQDGRAVLWNADDGSIRRELPSSGEPVTRTAFAPTGNRIATLAGTTVTVFDADDGMVVDTFEGTTSGSGLAFAPDGASVAIAIGDNVEIHRLGIPNAPPILLAGHRNTVHDFEFSGDGELLATGSSDGTAKLWRVADATLLHTLDGGQRLVDTVAFSPDGHLLATGALAHGDAHVWSVDTGAEVATLRGHRGLVYSVDFAPNGSEVISAGADGTVRTWDAVSGAEREPLLGHTGSVRSVEFDPTGERAATAGLDGTVRIWTASPPEQRHAYGELGGSSAIVADVSPDGRWVASGHGDGSVAVQDVASGAMVGQLDYGFEVRDVSFAPVSQRLLIVAGNGDADITESGAASTRPWLRGVNALAYSGAWSPGEDRVAIGSVLGVDVRRPGAETERRLEDQPGTPGITSVEFSPDGRFLAAALFEAGVAVWDTQTWDEVHRARIGGYAGAVAWSRDQRFLALCDNTAGIVRVLDATSLSEVKVLSGAQGSVRDVAFNDDGSLIATAGQDGAVHVWDWRAGKELVALSGHQDAVFSVKFLRTDDELVSSSGDGTTRIWSCELCVDLDSLIAIAQRRVTREFTAEERERYLAPVGRA